MDRAHWQQLIFRPLELQEPGMKWLRTGKTGRRSANGAMLQTVKVAQPTAQIQTVHTRAHVDVPLGDKGTSHGTSDSVMVPAHQAADKHPPLLNACAGEPSAGKETSPDILVFVALRDCLLSYGHSIQGNCLRDTAIINRWAAKG